MNTFWLLIAIPLASAAILLLLGRRADRWGHWLGVASIGAAFVLGLVYFFQLGDLPADERSAELTLFQFIHVGSLSVDFGLLFDPLSAVFVLLITGVGFLIHLYAVGYMAGDPGRRTFFGYFNLFVAAMLAARARQQLRDALLRLGGRGPRLVPADLVLVHAAQRRDGRQEGVHHEPRRRRGPGHRDLPDVRHARYGQLHRGRRRPAQPVQRRHPGPGSAAADRRVRQVGPVPAAGLAARRDGGPDPGLGPHPRRHHGHRRGLPDRPGQPHLQRQLHRAGLRGRGRCADPRDRRHHRLREGRHQARAGLVDRLPDRLHVPRRRAGRSRVRAGHHPPARARLLQGRALPRRRLGHARA